MKVVLLPANLDGSGCYRCLLPGRELRFQYGWEARMAPHQIREQGRVRIVEFHGGDRDILAWLLQEDFDVLLWQQRPEKWTAELSRRLRAQGKRVLVDSDDLWFNLPKWNPGSTRNPDEAAYMCDQLRAADGLSVATPALARAYERYQPNVRVIRNRLDWNMWEHVTPAYEQERRSFRIGWMGDAKWRAGDIDVLRPWLGEWLEQHPDVEFCAAGDTTGLVHDHIGVPPGQRVSTAPADFYSFDLADILAFDIGLVPLKLDDPRSRNLNECKSHLKGLEYAAAGIPCIASPTESYRWWKGNAHRSCHLAATPDEWTIALDEMCLSWRERGRRARLAAAEHTLQRHASEWHDWLGGSPDPEPPRQGAATPAGVAVS